MMWGTYVKGGIYMKKMKFVTLLLCLALIISFAMGCSGGDSTPGSNEGGAGSPVFLSLATGGTSGTYFPLGGALANIITNNVDNVKAQAEATGASVENATLIQKKESDLALIQNDIAFYAATGTVLQKFIDEGQYDNLKGLAILYPEVIQLVAAKDSGITSVTDLAGKKVAVGAPGSGTEANAKQILEAYGLSFDDLGKIDPLSFAEAAEQLKNKQIDAAFVTAGIPTAAITEVSTVTDIVIVPIETDKIKTLQEEYPFYTEVTIPGGSYKGQDEDITTAAVMAMLAVRGDLDEDVVFNITKSIFEHTDELGSVHEKGKLIKVEDANTGMPIDLHPGALKYYQEKGVK